MGSFTDMEAAINALTTSNLPTTAKLPPLITLAKLLDNIAVHPQVEKYRIINMDNGMIISQFGLADYQRRQLSEGLIAACHFKKTGNQYYFDSHIHPDAAAHAASVLRATAASLTEENFDGQQDKTHQKSEVHEILSLPSSSQCDKGKLAEGNALNKQDNLISANPSIARNAPNDLAQEAIKVGDKEDEHNIRCIPMEQDSTRDENITTAELQQSLNDIRARAAESFRRKKGSNATGNLPDGAGRVPEATPRPWWQLFTRWWS